MRAVTTEICDVEGPLLRARPVHLVVEDRDAVADLVLPIAQVGAR